MACFVLGALNGASGAGIPVTLAWNANPERDIAGYRLFYGIDYRNYSNTIDVGNTVAATVSDLPSGIVYYFAVKAYNRSGFESAFSNRVAYSAPGPTPSPGPSATPGPTPLITVVPSSISFSAVAGGPVPTPQNIQVTTSTGGTWSSFSNSPWFNAAPTGGPSGSSTTLTAHTQGLVVGTYADQIIFSGVGLPNRTVAVTLTITPGSIARDDFNRADGELGANWTKDPTWGGGLSISGNKVVAINSGVHYWNVNTFKSDQYSQVRLVGAVGSWSGVIVRGNPRPAPFYLVKATPTGVTLYSSLNGIFTQLAQNTTGWAAGDVLRLEARTLIRNTAHLTVYRNGTEVFSYDDAASFIASGQPGIGLRTSIQGMSLDDWEGGELGSGQF